MFFKVLAGSHTENGREYKAGQVVESERDLADLFVNKFEKVQAPAPAPSVPDAPPAPRPGRRAAAAPQGAAVVPPDTSPEKPGYAMRPRADKKGFDVVLVSTGKPVNDKPLTKKQATDLMATANE